MKKDYNKIISRVASVRKAQAGGKEVKLMMVLMNIKSQLNKEDDSQIIEILDDAIRKLELLKDVGEF